MPCAQEKGHQKIKADQFFERFLLLFSSSLEAAASTQEARYEQGFRP
jgi:hypothetical protein